MSLVPQLLQDRFRVLVGHPALVAAVRHVLEIKSSKENQGKFEVLNFAIGITTTEYIGCLDADSYVDPSSLKHLMKRFSKSEVMAVTPSMIIDKPENILGRMQHA